MQSPGNKTVSKLAKICGMLGSSHDGERASAALLASQILEDLDISWSDLVIAAFEGKAPSPTGTSVEYDRRTAGWHVSYCNWLIINRGRELNEWEMQFLNSLLQKYKRSSLTVKQAACLVKVATKHGLEIK
jgi:hypothetical protein